VVILGSDGADAVAVRVRLTNHEARGVVGVLGVNQAETVGVVLPDQAVACVVDGSRDVVPSVLHRVRVTGAAEGGVVGVHGRVGQRRGNETQAAGVGVGT